MDSTTSYSDYGQARIDFSNALAEYHRQRLKLDDDAAAVRLKYSNTIGKLEGRSKAVKAAGRKSGAPPTERASRYTDRQVDAALAAVEQMSYTYGGFFEKMKRNSAGRAAGSYLNSVAHLFEPEIQQLREAEKKELQTIEVEQAEAEAAIRRSAKEFGAISSSLVSSVGAPALPMSDSSWKSGEWEDANGVIQLVDVYHYLGDDKLSFPYLARIPGANLFIYAKWCPERHLELVNSVLVRALRAAPPGRLRLLLIDPTTLGNAFAPLLSIGEHSEAAITTKVWSAESDIRSRLEEMSDRVSLIIQKYLTDEFETLDEYNVAAGEVAEEGVIIAINDFPRGLDRRSLEIVKSLAEVGHRCGISLVISQADSGFESDRFQVCHDIANLSHRLARTDSRSLLANQSGSIGIGMRMSTDSAFEKAGSFLDVFYRFDGQLVPRVDSFDWIGGASRGWHTAPLDAFDGAAVQPVLDSVGRGFESGSRVEVQLERVWELFNANEGRDIAPRMDDPSTLWKASSEEGLRVPVGRHGSRGVSVFDFNSQLLSSALLVGRPGSGKSNLLHVAICSLASMYSPSELELYLLDFKEAVEFAGYVSAELPQAAAIALEADREFGLAVLEHISAEIERRGKLFRSSAGEQTNIISYRRTTGESMPRILLLIDEFHRLFDREDSIATDAAKHLDDIIRLGRGFGVHCILASQTLLGMSALGRHTLNQVTTRAALQCSDEDSRIVFDDDNPAASLLSRPGEAVLNTGGGREANNEPFQVPMLPEEERRALLDRIRVRAKGEAQARPTRVYRRDVQANWVRPVSATTAEPLSLRFGHAVAIDPDLECPLRREGGGERAHRRPQ